MRLSLSVRVAEAPGSKERTLMPLDEIARLAKVEGYHAVCMRASQAGVRTPLEQVAAMRGKLDALGLEVSMVTGDFPIPRNDEHAPSALRNIGPYLSLAETVGTSLIRVGMKEEADIVWAQRACDEAQERGIRLAHQCHTQSLFETVHGTLEVLRRVDRENFGIIYEPANLEACGQDYGPKTIERFAPYLLNVYLQNQRLTSEGRDALETWIRGRVPFDPIPLQDLRGIDFPQIFEGLKAIGYDGYVTVHQAFADILTPQEAARQSAEYLRSIAAFETPR